jgi:hypothetical protein
VQDLPEQQQQQQQQQHGRKHTSSSNSRGPGSSSSSNYVVQVQWLPDSMGRLHPVRLHNACGVHAVVLNECFCSVLTALQCLLPVAGSTGKNLTCLTSIQTAASKQASKQAGSSNKATASYMQRYVQQESCESLTGYGISVNASLCHHASMC